MLPIKVFIVDSPSQNGIASDSINGERLFQFLTHADICCVHSVAHNRQMLEGVLQPGTFAETLKNGVLPILHLCLEATEYGSKLNDGSEVGWQDLAIMLARINSAMDGGLIVCMHSFHGDKMTKNKDGDRQFLLFVGSKGRATWPQIAIGFVTFYFHVTQESKDAIAAMRVASGHPDFERLTGPGTPEDSWKDVLKKLFQRYFRLSE